MVIVVSVGVMFVRTVLFKSYGNQKFAAIELQIQVRLYFLHDSLASSDFADWALCRLGFPSREKKQRQSTPFVYHCFYFGKNLCKNLLLSFSIPLPFSGPQLLNSHMALRWFYFIAVTFETLTNHSGFHLPGFKSPEFHDFHHLK